MKKNTRRAFLALGKLENDGSSNLGDNQPNREDELSENKVKMLTPDGQLVEIDKHLLANGQKKKASNEDIMRWSENRSFKHS